MKKTIILLSLFIFTINPGFAFNQESLKGILDFENTNSSEQEIKGSLDSSEDLDYYKINIPERSNLIIEAQDFNLVYTVLDKNEITLAHPIYNFIENSSNIKVELGKSEEVYIVVAMPFSEKLDYKLKLRLKSNFKEINVQELNFNHNRSFNIQNELSRGARNIYEIKTRKPRLVIFKTTGNANTAAELFDENQNLISSDKNSGRNKNFFLKTRLEPGKYFLRVRDELAQGAIGLGNSANYRLKSATYATRKDIKLDGENLNKASQRVFEFNENSKNQKLRKLGAFDYPQDKDFYKIVLKRAGKVSIKSYGVFDTVGRLFNEKGEELSKGDQGGPKIRNFIIDEELQEGTYFIEISRFASAFFSKEGKYILEINYSRAI